MTTEEARDLLVSGSPESLVTALNSTPSLVSARILKCDAPYDGYFHGATLLHHTALNPNDWYIADGADVKSIVDMAKILVAHGAEVDAATLAGPTQPKDIGWTALGLAATSTTLRNAGLQLRLMEFLVEAGADLDARNGGALMGALYYGEVGAAKWLVQRGARCDAIAAAGLGMPSLASYFQDDHLEKAHTLAHYSQVELEDQALRVDRDHVLGLCTIYASMHGHVESLKLLIDDLGAPVNARPFFDHRATPLHWAAKEAQIDALNLLVERGADLLAKDATYDANPREWNRHCCLDARVQELLSTDCPDVI